MCRLQGPGIEYLRKQAEILYVARDYGEAVALGGGHDQAIHHREGAPSQFGLGGELRPAVQGSGVERQDAAGEALFHLAQPCGVFLAAARVGGAQLEDALLDFAQGDDAEMEAGFVLLVQPGDDLRRGRFPDVFGEDAGVQQPAHSSTLRPVSGLREKSRSLPARSGCNSAAESLPRRGRVNFAEASADTTTAVGLPCTVTTWASPLAASLMSWLRLFFASCNCHSLFMMNSCLFWLVWPEYSTVPAN